MKRLPSAATITVALLLVALSSFAKKEATYDKATLVDMSDSSSNRVVGNGTSMVTVTDVEYRLSVQIGNMVYVGSYWPRTRWSYAPHDLVVNSPIDARVDGKHMYLLLPNGKELKTEIVKRISAK